MALLHNLGLSRYMFVGKSPPLAQRSRFVSFPLMATIVFTTIFSEISAAQCVTTVSTTTTYGATQGSVPSANSCYEWQAGDLTFGSYTNLTSSGSKADNLIHAVASNGNFINNGILTSTGARVGLLGLVKSINSVTNNGTMISSAHGIDNNGSGNVFGSIINNGTITLTTAGYAGIILFSTDPVSSVINTGTINASVGASTSGIVNLAGTVSTLQNSGFISFTAAGIVNSGTVLSLTNSGAITSAASSSSSSNDSGINIYNDGEITSLTNSGTMSTNVSYGVANDIHGVITTLTNTGSIVATGSNTYGVYNVGSIVTLNNGQGAGNANGALTYTGVLPTSYKLWHFTFVIDRIHSQHIP
jgi:hypothetical protein